MANVLPGKGTLLQIKISSTFTTIGNRMKLDGPDPELKTRDVTHLDSPMVTTRVAIVDPGTISGTLFFDPNDTVTHTVLRGKIYTPPALPDEFKMIYPDGDTTPANDDFKGFMTKFKVTGQEVEGSLQAEFEIRITDLFTATAGVP